MKRTFSIYAAAMVLVISTGIVAQIADTRPPLTKQVAAPLPKLALLGAVQSSVGGTKYSKVALTVTNRNGIPAEIFALPNSGKLPPNPCAGNPSRAAVVIYSERGTPLGKCINLPSRESLANFSFLVEKGKSVPPYVYVIIADLYTGAVYRSNMVSPFGGGTK